LASGTRDKESTLRLGAASVLLTIASLGCTHIPKTQPYVLNMGAKTCGELGRAAVSRSTEEFLAGTVIAALGATGVGTGIAMGPDTAPDAAWHERSRFLLIMAPSAVVTAIGVAIAARSQETNSLADKTTIALSQGKDEADRYLYYECVSARADWSGDRSDMTRLQISLLKENLAAAKTAQEAASTADTESQTATSLAIDAKTTAVKAAQVAFASAEATRDLAIATEKIIDAMPKKDGNALIRDAKAALAGRKDSIAPKPESATPRLQAPPSPVAQPR